MDQVFCAILAAIVAFVVDLSRADQEYMVTNAESITVPFDFETKLQCLMNIEPDKFQWKFYPLAPKDAFNPKALINLSKSNYSLVPGHKYTVQRRQSDLTLQADTKEITGDYQCLAYYGASVVASIPWRITIATLGRFPKQDNLDVTVTAGNTVNWRCEPPDSNPEAYIDYYKNENYILPSNPVPTKSLILTNINTNHTGRYKCRALNAEQGLDSTAVFNLRVARNGAPKAPHFLMEPRRLYVVNKGESVFLECSAIGNPIPKVEWLRKNGLLPKDRADVINGGLIIRNVSSTDDGIYVCTHKNLYGTIIHQITLIYNEEPSIECLLNSTDVKQGEDLDLDCAVKGTPEPQISWFLNGFTISNDSAVEAIGNRIYFRPTEKRHAGNLQIFARNSVKTVYSSISIKVIPLSSSVDVAVSPTRTHHNRHNPKNNARKLPKHTKMIPPTKPSISRLNDEAVVVRWSVPANKGLPIQFFKVQYRELGPINHNDHHGRGKGSRWRTTNADIPPHIGSYEVNNLKPDHIYKFRIAAVYSNNDNKLSQNSDKFVLRKLDFDNRNPLPVPLITRTEAINSTSVKIYWKHTPANMSVDGFFINYISASSAADYMKATIDGESTDSYILSHLQPDTVYDIKLQSFTTKSASEFSQIMKARTMSVESTIAPIKETTLKPSNKDSPIISKLYVIVAGAVIGGGLLISGVVLLVFCRKWKQKKNRDDRDKPNVDIHQVDNNDYIVSSKSVARSNGCTPNRITITSNPLADADNKNQNMIEMSCLSSTQNNNCSIQPSVSGETNNSPPLKKDCNKKNNKRNIRSNKDTTAGENYV